MKEKDTKCKADIMIEDLERECKERGLPVGKVGYKTGCCAIFLNKRPKDAKDSSKAIKENKVNK